MNQSDLRPIRTEKTTLISFDGGVAEAVQVQRPDRYRLIEAGRSRFARIARGGGYSYAAASFGPSSTAVVMNRFNRVLRFDPGRCTIEVEAGMALGNLLALTSRAGLGISVQPGYPAITVGGCIAANVHGKNPVREGTFADVVVDLTLFHPEHGVLRIGPEDREQLLELTCGGYGLTGIILAATLRLAALPGPRVNIHRIPVGDPIEAAAIVRELADRSLFAYSWHDATPRNRTFGRGFVYQGLAVPGPVQPHSLIPRYTVLTAAGRARLPFSLWGTLTARAFASAYRHIESLRPSVIETSLFDAIFPFARRAAYFRLFGRSGLAEYQVIVPSDRLGAFLQGVRRLILSTHAPSVMLSLKSFRGSTRLLRFEADGTCVTLNLARSSVTAAFLAQMDVLTIDVGGIPNIIKDSRLPRRVVEACYSDHEPFRKRIRSFDPGRVFKSELSERLGL